MALVDRRMHGFVVDLLQDEPALLIQGPRAVGKTTLLRELARTRSVPIIDLSDARTRTVAADGIESYFTDLAPPVLIDEYQYLPAVLSFVKRAVDQSREPGLFVLAGSTTADLLPRGTESMAGRLHDVTLWGFSEGELRSVRERFIERAFADPHSFDRLKRAPESRSDYVSLVVRGSFPDAVLREREMARTRWFRSYAHRVVERDLAELVHMRQPALLNDVLGTCAARTGLVLNVSDVCDDLGAGKAVVSRYIDLLERVFLVRRLPAYSRNQVGRLTKHPKMHLADTGLAAALMGLDASNLRRNPLFGALLESFVVGEVRKQLSWSDTDIRLFHFRDRDSAEVDIVLEAPDGRIVGIEVKSADSANTRDAAGLRRLAAVVGDDFVHGFVFYTGPGAFQLGTDPRFSAIPIAALWADLGD